ncbi:MAG: NAD(P)-binding protein [Desulfobacterium sp.]|nr:NAD(P)-binding protein [Desulfobacterium sp.]
MKTDLKDAPIPTRGRPENPVPLFIPTSNASSRLNTTDSLRFAQPGFQNRTAPCSAFCPAGNDIPKIQHQVASGDIPGAFTTLMQETPFPSTCGRVCFHPCEGACNRAFQDSPVAIQSLEQFVGDTALALGLKSGLKPLTSNTRKVAILGAGPAGLSAAYFLTLLGFACEIFEETAEPGGAMRWGIPSHRLPKEILNQEIHRILSMGVTLHTNHALTPEFIKEAQGTYEGIFIAPGLSRVRDSIDTRVHEAWAPRKNVREMKLSHLTLSFRDPLLLFGGDPVNQNHSVADAIASGKQAAIALHTYMEGGRGPIEETLETCRTGNGDNLSMEIYLLGARSERSRQVVSPEEINRDYFKTALRQIPETATLDSAMGSFGEIEKTFSGENALAEASRCYQCGYCNGGDNCKIFCSEGTIFRAKGAETIDLDDGKRWGICAVECPRGAITME